MSRRRPGGAAPSLPAAAPTTTVEGGVSVTSYSLVETKSSSLGALGRLGRAVGSLDPSAAAAATTTASAAAGAQALSNATVLVAAVVFAVSAAVAVVLVVAATVTSPATVML